MTPDKDQKRRDAFHIFYESVFKSDHELRLYEMEEGCMDELMEWRSEIIHYLDGRREQL